MLGGSEPEDHVSGLVVRYDPSQPRGSRVVSVTMADGQPLSDARTYTVVVNNFVLHRGEGYNVESRAISSTPLDIIDLDALIRYLQQLPSPVTAPTEVRIAPIQK
jgi:2',3'-cyclic-nucleotide 2'-phosphodiesterase (5'-nucleotidase family)